MQMSHDLARKLLALPNLPISEHFDGTGEPIVEEEIDPQHPEYKEFEGKRFGPGHVFTDEWREWFSKQPKSPRINTAD